MAEATNTILGEIKLTGDLAGDGGAQVGSNPQLKTMPGLTAGQYNVANITVDTKGRITDIEGASSAQIAALIPDATNTVKGKVSIGSNIQTSSGATSGYQMVNFGGVLLTTTLLDHCESATYPLVLMVDGTTIEYSFAGSALGTDVEDMLAYINANVSGFTVTLDSGNLKVESDEVGSPSTIDITDDGIFSCMSSFVSLGTPVDGLSACEIYVNDATTTVAGVVQVGSGVAVSDGVISVSVGTVPTATTTTLGGVIVPTSGRLSIDGSGNLSVPLATNSVYGVVKVGTNLSIDGGGVLSATLPIASSSVLGGVKQGSNVNIDVNGVLTVDISSFAKATESSLGIMQVGTGLDVNGSGVVSVDISEVTLPVATEASKGIMQVGAGLDVDVNGIVSVDISEVTLPVATEASKGIMQVGNGLDVTTGVVSVDPTEILATTGVAGCVIAGTNISLSAGTISVPDANTSGTKGVLTVTTGTGLTLTSGTLATTNASTGGVKGVVSIGSNINVTNGEISVPDATIGGVKGVLTVTSGTGLTLTSGTLSATTAAAGVKGVVSIGSNINVTNGEISVPVGTSTGTKGVLSVTPNTGLTVTSGVLSGTNAAAGVKGVVSIGSNINVTNGDISVSLADSNTTFGLVKSGNTSEVLIASGVLTIGTTLARKNVSNTFTKSQIVQQVTQTFSTNWAPDLSLTNQFYMVLTDDFVLANPSSLSTYIGGKFRIVLKQDATGNRTISYGGYYKFPMGADTTLSTVGGNYDILFLEVISATEILCRLEKGWS